MIAIVDKVIIYSCTQYNIDSYLMYGFKVQGTYALCFLCCNFLTSTETGATVNGGNGKRKAESRKRKRKG